MLITTVQYHPQYSPSDDWVIIVIRKVVPQKYGARTIDCAMNATYSG